MMLCVFAGASTNAAELSNSTISVRTERYPRPPYSGATYYIYEREGKVICTKLEVCNKFNDCIRDFRKGPYKEAEDLETGDPYGRSEPTEISGDKLLKHVCLKRYKLTGGSSGAE